MEKKEKKELIEHIADTLKEQSLPYNEGAWERFAQTRLGHKRPVVSWAYVAGAAAIVLLGLGLFLRYDDAAEGGQIVQHRDSIGTTGGLPVEQGETRLVDVQDVDSDKNGAPEELRRHASAPEKVRGLPIAPFKEQQKRDLLALADRQIPNTREENSGLTPDVRAGAPLGHEAEGAVKDKLGEERQALAAKAARQDETTENLAARNDEKDIMQLFEQDKDKELELKGGKDKQPSTRKWGFGVAVAPLMTAESVNVGGGFMLAYQLTDKLSVGSGLSLVDLNVATDRVNPNAQFVMDAAYSSTNGTTPMNSISVAGSRELSSVSANVLGLDIPLDLKYELTKSFYIGAGVSLFTALNETRMNNYTTRLDNSLMVGNQGFASNRAPEIMAVRSSEHTSEAPIKNGGYSTFLNLSVGQKVPLSSYMGLSVEPFYKLPMGNIANQDMNFNYGGIRIIASF